MASSMAFTGFSPETLRFLRDLGAHNEKTWFDAPHLQID